MSAQYVKLWDLPTRLFHWLLATSVVVAIVTAKIGGNAMVWHGRTGLFIVGLVVFRIVWGLVGSTYARFSSFFPTPASVTTYLRGQWRGLGHNPLGALSVFGLLAVISFQAGTGLFANDDIAFRGPLFDLAGKDFSDRLTGMHHWTANILFALIALHLAAIAFYTHVKKDNLVKPMIDGWKKADADILDIRAPHGEGTAALAVALLLAATSVFAASGAWMPEPEPPPAQQQAPSW